MTFLGQHLCCGIVKFLDQMTWLNLWRSLICAFYSWSKRTLSWGDCGNGRHLVSMPSPCGTFLKVFNTTTNELFFAFLQPFSRTVWQILSIFWHRERERERERKIENKAAVPANLNQFRYIYMYFLKHHTHLFHSSEKNLKTGNSS